MVTMCLHSQIGHARRENTESLYTGIGRVIFAMKKTPGRLLSHARSAILNSRSRKALEGSILGSKTYRFCTQGKRDRGGNGNAKEGLCFLSASATYVPSPSVKSSLVPSPSNREVSEIMGVSDQGQVSKLMMAQ
jgi:hypothetical protein